MESFVNRVNMRVVQFVTSIQTYMVEVAYFMFFLSRHMTLPLFQEYVQTEIYKQHGMNTTAADHEEIFFPDYEDTASNDAYSAHRASVMAVLGLEMAEGFPAVVAVIVMGAVSDRINNHKMLLWVPALGSVAYSIIYILILFTTWTIDGLFMAAALRGLSGSMTAVYAGATYFAINSVEPEKRAWRLALQEFLNGIAYCLANIMVGFWVKDHGFHEPFIFSLICSCISYLVAFFLVKEVKTNTSNVNEVNQHEIRVLSRNYSSEPNCCIDTFKPMAKFFKCRGNRNLIKIWLAILAFQTYAIVHIGQINTLVLYLRGPDYGWSSPMIGMFLAVIMGVAAIGTVATPPVLKLLFSDTNITMLGILSKALGSLWIAVVKNETVLYFAIMLLVLELLPFPMLRSIVANNINTGDQGSLFALMHCTESISYFLAPLMFQAMYAKSFHIYSGLVFIISSLFLILPVLFMIGIRYMTKTTPGDYEPMAGETELTDATDVDHDERHSISIISAQAETPPVAV